MASMQKRCASIRQQFLNERADLMASKLHTSEEKALKAILKAEESKRTFAMIRDLLKTQQVPFTQIDVLHKRHIFSLQICHSNI